VAKGKNLKPLAKSRGFWYYIVMHNNTYILTEKHSRDNSHLHRVVFLLPETTPQGLGSTLVGLFLLPNMGYLQGNANPVKVLG
jgi:hypothetical protein